MDENNQNAQTTQNNVPYETVFCFNCGQKVAKLAIVCPHCGVSLQQNQPQQPGQPQTQPIIINNTNTNTNTNTTAGRQPKVCNKWVSFLLCFFLGIFGAHCFYEGRVGKGILYLFTAGCCGFGVLIDLIIILCKPNPYSV